MNKEKLKEFLNDNLIFRNRTVLIATLICGVVAHGQVLFNKYMFHDEAHEVFGIGETIISGRWFLYVIGRIYKLIAEHLVSISLVNGLFSLLCLSICGILIVDMLKIRSKFMQILVGEFLVTAPMLVSLFLYMFTAPSYSLGYLMAAFGVWLFMKYWNAKAFAIGVILCGCATGIYQAIIPFYISLLLVAFVFQIHDSRSMPWKEYILRVAKLVLFCVISLIFYYLMLQVFLRVKNLELTDYQGIDHSMVFTLPEMVSRVLNAYKYFIKFLPWSMFVKGTKLTYWLSIIFLFVVLVVYLVRKIRGREYADAIQLLIPSLFVPLSINFICVMLNESSGVHTLMQYSQCIIWVYVIKVLDILWEKGNSKKIIGVVIAMGLVLTASAAYYVIYDNTCYLKAEIYQQRTIQYYTTMVTKIKSVEGYKDEYPVVYINEDEMNDSSMKNIDVFDKYSLVPMYEMNTVLKSYAWRDIVRLWCGYEPEYGDAEDFENLPEVQQMPHYPDDGSIKVIDETVVVKF